MHTLFISDLHLSADRPRINQQFFDFIDNTAPQAEALYILGDLFEYWAGDDDLADALNISVADAFTQSALTPRCDKKRDNMRAILSEVCPVEPRRLSEAGSAVLKATA